MYYERDSREFNVIVGLALGAIVGAAIAYLILPRDLGRGRRLSVVR